MKIQRLLFILFFFLKLNSGFSQWNIMPTGTTDNLVDICFPSDSIGFSVGYNGIVLKTIDQGNTWNQIANFGGSITSVCNVGRDTIFVGGDRIYRSDDCGNTWDTIISLPFTISDLHFFNSLNGVYINPYTYICGSYIIKNYKI